MSGTQQYQLPSLMALLLSLISVVTVLPIYSFSLTLVHRGLVVGFVGCFSISVYLQKLVSQEPV